MSRNKTEVEEARILDFNIFQKACKNGGDSGAYRWWFDGEPNGKINYILNMDNERIGKLHLSYKILLHNPNEEDKHYDYSLNVCSSRCNYGGYRYWLECPLLHNGNACNRRVRKLYMAPGCDYFGCRECLDLTYESKSKNYHYSQFSPLKRYYDYIELFDKTKTLYYKGKLTRKARRLQRLGASIKDF